MDKPENITQLLIRVTLFTHLKNVNFSMATLNNGFPVSPSLNPSLN